MRCSTVCKRLVLLIPIFLGAIWLAHIFSVHTSGAVCVIHIPLEKVEPALTEDLALLSSNEAMRRAGLDLSEFELVPNPLNTAPSGAGDKVFSRNSINSNSGYVMYINKSARYGRGVREWFVNLELRNNEVICEVSPAK